MQEDTDDARLPERPGDQQQPGAAERAERPADRLMPPSAATRLPRDDALNSRVPARA